MSVLSDIIADGAHAGSQHPWPCAMVSEQTWAFAAEQLAKGEWTLVAMWAEPSALHLAVTEPVSSAVGLMTLRAPTGHFPSIGRIHPPARRIERAIRDLYGLVATDSADTRPWLDHGCWNVEAPLGSRIEPRTQAPYPFLPTEGEGLHQIPVGPVHAGIIEPGHFRFTANGETVARLEARLGYVHKGIEGLMVGAPIERAAQLAARASGDTTVAYSIAFARAVEVATGTEPPPRALWLRALMLELERIANHFGDIGAICNDAAFSLMHAHTGVLRERVLRAAFAAFGHRLMMDRVVPGGVACDLAKKDIKLLLKLLKDIRKRFPRLVELYEETTSLQDRTVGTGIVQSELVIRFSAGGYIGRASGRNFDARRAFAFAPYDRLTFDIPVMEKGDVDARVMIRIREVEQSLSLIEQILEQMPEGDLRAQIASGFGEGAALVEGFRGDIFAWVRMSGSGRVERCHLRDPSQFQWPLLEAAIEGNIVADFPLCNKSFNCSYAGHDL